MAENFSPLTLYHGTSTLFLSSIVEHGLGGRNIIDELGFVRLARAIHPIVKSRLADDEHWMLKAGTFENMVRQVSAGMNFQHGHTYVSASAYTALRYSLSARRGSELITATLDFLDEIARVEPAELLINIERQFPRACALRDISPASILIKISETAQTELLDEFGQPPDRQLDRLKNCIEAISRGEPALLQQINFRLARPISLDKLSFWLVELQEWDPYLPKHVLHLLSIPGARNEAPPAAIQHM